ncbi:hypothetical protein V6N12_054282 [Hibiscus sabdariffa]|uniref:Uncharacterized protein n=1 Tax=Hibiscus sabdariffa TaxID=183260 RepID=A0ABR2D1N2_9ROSI
MKLSQSGKSTQDPTIERKSINFCRNCPNTNEATRRGPFSANPIGTRSSRGGSDEDASAPFKVIGPGHRLARQLAGSSVQVLFLYGRG